MASGKQIQCGGSIADEARFATPQLGHDTGTRTRQDSQTPRYSAFKTWQKRILVLSASLTAFFSPLTVQIILPALNSIAKDLDATTPQVNLTITMYMVVQGFIPILIGPLADTGGRRPAYLICFVMYIAANIGLALVPDFGALLALRCLQSAGSSPMITLCTAVVADVVTSAERGTYIGITIVPSMLGPALGPIIGGLLSKFLGWRSIFWLLTILAGAALCLVGAFFPETCRQIVGDGSILPPPLHRTAMQAIRRPSMADQPYVLNREFQPKSKLRISNLVEPLLMLRQKETALLLATTSFTFAGLYAIAAAIPSQFEERYGLGEIEVGLMYLPLVVGSVVTAGIVGPLLGWNYRRHCLRLGLPFDRSRQMDLSEFPIERARLEIGVALIAPTGAALIAWGWAVHTHAHLSAPIILGGLLCTGVVGLNNAVNALLIDVHPGKPGTVMAAGNLTRCLLGAAISALIIPMINGVGIGGSFAILGGLDILCIPLTWLVILRGPYWRAKLEVKRKPSYCLEDGAGVREAVDEPVPGESLSPTHDALECSPSLSHLPTESQEVHPPNALALAGRHGVLISSPRYVPPLSPYGQDSLLPRSNHKVSY